MRGWVDLLPQHPIQHMAMGGTPINDDDLPLTVAMAVRILIGILDEASLLRIASVRQEDLIDLHVSVGGWVRNYFGLWKQAGDLYEACGSVHPDDASMVIVGALWFALQPSDVSLH
jgi:hypothetical protein